jgi:CMP-N-acetylneuraminic acid synthetase
MRRIPSCLAIIPARGGSKGVPRKNIRLLSGRPLIGWTIEAAREAQQVSRVVVSTDDEDIARVSKQFGAEVVQRPIDISGDTASSESALLHTLNHLRETEGYQPDLTAFLQCTSPFTASADIDATILTLREQRADSAFSASRFFHYIWRMDEPGASGINHDKKIRQRRQDRAPEYLENGAIYVMETTGFLEAKHRFFGKTVIHEMDARRSLEIDDLDDFAMAEAVLRNRAA